MNSNITKEDVVELKKLYNDAVKNKLTEIKFQDGTVVLVSYLKYLVEYLETKYK